MCLWLRTSPSTSSSKTKTSSRTELPATPGCVEGWRIPAVGTKIGSVMTGVSAEICRSDRRGGGHSSLIWSYICTSSMSTSVGSTQSTDAWPYTRRPINSNKQSRVLCLIFLARLSLVFSQALPIVKDPEAPFC
jgi:hypothetical protein